MNIEFHMYQSHGFLFLVATEIKQADDKAYEYLRSVQERFIALRLDSVEDQGSKLSLNKHFKAELKNIMQQYNTNRKLWNTQQSMQSLGQIRGQVNEVTNIMRQNIASVLDRGEALEDIVTRANDLQATTDVFHRQTTHINRQLYWKNMRMRICLIAMVLSIFAVIIIWASVKTAKDHTTTTQRPEIERTSPSS
jgi:hypothetical protein